MLLRVILIVGIVCYVIGRQLIGEPLRGKRVMILPLVLIAIGLSDLPHGPGHARPVDYACLVVGGVLVAGIGAGLGAVTRLEAHDGYLWGRLPVRGLLLWLALIVSRVLMTLVADGLHAHVAASSATILLMLGINRLGQAVVILVRAISAGIPFAPEKDGRTFLSGGLNDRGRDHSARY